MKKYTLGEVVDIMKLNEVAIKVEGNFSDEDIFDNHIPVKGLQFDENDNGILKELDGSRIVLSNNPKFSVEYYIILSREYYQKVLDTRQSLVATAY